MVTPVVSLSAGAEIEAFARQYLFQHLYESGDLDNFHWPYTTYYGWREGVALRQVLVAAAIAIYHRLSFETISEYEAYSLSR
jgi:hypothetical protein